MAAETAEAAALRADIERLQAEGAEKDATVACLRGQVDILIRELAKTKADHRRLLEEKYFGLLSNRSKAAA